MIRRLLVANRGEISLRIQRTAHEMGIETVAVFSDADADAPFVRAADYAVRIGPAPSAESYLVMERIIEAAKTTGADAIHPGYGFLAENAAFAQQVTDAGITFVGPTPDAIEKMGSKQRAKAIARDAGVPTVPGYQGDDQSDETLVAQAEKIGFPVLVKASAGGGGKGMQIVRSTEDTLPAIQSARRLAESSFGDGTLLIEKYIERPRHVEIQILGDAHGNVIHLFERECSIQRRYQKIIEESPSTALDFELRNKMGDAAVALAKAIGYQNAGTVEFILDSDSNFYFLEVNTRLQVEHPVTEEITGLDLVREQLNVAEGEPLSYEQEDLFVHGASVECRIYAEDPATGFLPSIGTLTDWHIAESADLRVDSGVESGSEVSVHYDPMLAKIITWGADRKEATRRMVRALRGLSVQGVRTNREFLVDVLTHPEYAAGNLHTHFVDEHFGEIPVVRGTEMCAAAIVATLHDVATRGATRELLPNVPLGFRNNRNRGERVTWLAGETVLRVEYDPSSMPMFRVLTSDGVDIWRLIALSGPDITVENPRGVRSHYRVIRAGANAWLHAADGDIHLREQPRFPDPTAEDVAGGCIAPTPGKVTVIHVSEGDQVEAGAALVVLEAMKMEQTITAPDAGTVQEIRVAVGDQVEADQVLVVMGDAEE